MVQGILGIFLIVFAEALIGALFGIKNYHPISGSTKRNKIDYYRTPKSYVRGYYRKNGTYVSGHTRRNY